MTATPDIGVGYLLGDVTRLFRTRFDRRATRFGLTRAQWRVLRRLHAREGLHQSELAELLEMDPIAVGRVIDRLQLAGFVQRRADPNDRRCWRLFLTERSRSVVDDMERIADELRGEAYAGIERDDLERLVEVLAQVKENLQSMDPESSEGISQ